MNRDSKRGQAHVAPSFVPETELPGKEINVDTLQVIAHRYLWSSEFVAGKDVLEIGCGPGLGLGWLSRCARRVVGGDIMQESLGFAGQYYGGKVGLVSLDAHRLPFRNESFDVVLCVAAIIYMDAAALFAECRRVLRKGGLLLVNTPNKDQPGFQPSRLSREYHSVPDLHRLLAEHAFDTRCFGAFPASSRPVTRRPRALSMARAAVSKALGVLGLRHTIKALTGLGARGVTLKHELDDEEMALVRDIQLTPLSTQSPDQQYRIVYAVCHAR